MMTMPQRPALRIGRARVTGRRPRFRALKAFDDAVAPGHRHPSGRDPVQIHSLLSGAPAAFMANQRQPDGE
jgi:hypothetical protein